MPRQGLPMASSLTPRISLRTRLFLLLLGIVVTMAALFVFLGLRFYAREVQAELEVRARSLASLLAESVAGSFYDPGRFDRMRTYLENVRATPEVVYAYAFDREGRILADGTRENPHFRGVPADPFHAPAVRSPTALLQYRDPRFTAPGNVLDAAHPFFDTERQRLGGVRIGFTLASVQREIARARLAGLALGALFVLVGMALSAWTSARLVRPVADLVRGTRLVAGGQLDVAIPVTSRDELGVLGDSFNRMAAALREQQAAIERKIGEQRALYEIGQEIIAQVALQPTLRLIVDRARTLLDADMAALALREDGQDLFAMRAVAGEGSEALAAVRFRPGEGLGGRVARTGRPLIVGDYPVEVPDSPFLPLVRGIGARSHVAVPLTVQGSVTGVLYVVSRAPHKFGEVDQQLLTVLADQAAIAIEHARLFEDTRRYARELEGKVAERTRALQDANRQLEGKNRELEVANRHKSQFLANMSHELRTPLNAILGYTELVLDEIYGPVPERLREVLGRVQENGRHLLRLINDVLDLSKIEAGELRLSLADYSLADVVQSAVTAVEPLAAEKGLGLRAVVPEGLPLGRGDERRLLQVLLNLVGNAVKFTTAGEVRVAARLVGGAFEVSVSDTGPGIPEGEQERIFEEFHQVDSSSTRQAGGTGLGLAIARRIVALHGGRIGVRSQPGQGSTFSVLLPIRVEG